MAANYLCSQSTNTRNKRQLIIGKGKGRNISSLKGAEARVTKKDIEDSNLYQESEVERTAE